MESVEDSKKHYEEVNSKISDNHSIVSEKILELQAREAQLAAKEEKLKEVVQDFLNSKKILEEWRNLIEEKDELLQQRSERIMELENELEEVKNAYDEKLDELAASNYFLEQQVTEKNILCDNLQGEVARLLSVETELRTQIETGASEEVEGLKGILEEKNSTVVQLEKELEEQKNRRANMEKLLEEGKVAFESKLFELRRKLEAEENKVLELQNNSQSQFEEQQARFQQKVSNI